MSKPTGWDRRHGWQRSHRFAVMLSDEEVKSLDDWRFENRVATRADAVRQLIAAGLAAKAKEEV